MAGRIQVAHMVYFTLKERTAAAIENLVADCRKFLTDHPGTVYFSAGSRGAEFTREVNDSEYDVGLHVVFDSKASHDAYQAAPRHVEFVTRNKPTWAKVRVFDTYV